MSSDETRNETIVDNSDWARLFCDESEAKDVGSGEDVEEVKLIRLEIMTSEMEIHTDQRGESIEVER